MSRELGNTGNQIAELEEQTEASRPMLEARMVELYKLGAPATCGCSSTCPI